MVLRRNLLPTHCRTSHVFRCCVDTHEIFRCLKVSGSAAFCNRRSAVENLRGGRKDKVGHKRNRLRQLVYVIRASSPA